MKATKLLVLATALVMLISVFGVQAFAADATVTVYVTIANGSLVMTQEAIAVTDVDSDGALTVNDALFLAHEAKFNGGAEAGYGSAVGDYGLALTKLWGVENGGSYGYYINNASAMGLADPVKDGDYINAFIYTDTDAFSDAYCYFDANTISVINGKEFSLTLYAAGYDENWAPVVNPVADAVILIDGVETAFKTDAAGKAVIKIDSASNCVISAKSEAVTLVPPVCVASIAVAAPQTGDSGVMLYAVIAMVSLGAMASVMAHQRKIRVK